MKLKYTKSFLKTVEKLKDKSAIDRLELLIKSLKQAKNLKEIPNVIPIENAVNFYRIKTGNYRLLIEQLKNGEIIVLLIDYRRRNEKTYKGLN